VGWIFTPSVFPARKIIFLYIDGTQTTDQLTPEYPQHCVGILRKRDDGVRTDLLKKMTLLRYELPSSKRGDFLSAAMYGTWGKARSPGPREISDTYACGMAESL
jgi:hypothetical protein